MNPPEVTVLPRAARRLRLAHPWIFRDELADTGTARSGDLVRVLGEGRRSLGFAFYSQHSKIALRWVSEGDQAPHGQFWQERVDRAWRYRQQVVRDGDACRLIFGESDGLPGLVADRYGDHLVVQCLTAAAEGLLPVVLDALVPQWAFASVLARNDPAVRTLEGLPRETLQIRGSTPPLIEVQEGSIRYLVDPWAGQKTGAFLDQRDNRVAAAASSRGRVLDLFCYQGNFALHAAAGADEVIAVDSSAVALERGRTAAGLNQLRGVSFLEANVFEELRRRERSGERFDLVFLDPPAFAKSRADLPAARRAYKEINLRAMRLLEAGGMLVTSSCSYNLSEDALLEILASAAADARRTIRVVDRRTQSKDHPIRLGFPESQYLKCLVLSVI